MKIDYFLSILPEVPSLPINRLRAGVSFTSPELTSVAQRCYTNSSNLNVFTTKSWEIVAWEYILINHHH